MAIARIGSHVETNGEGVGSAAGWVVAGLRTVVVVVVLVVGAVVAVVSFVCSIGNVPLAAVLWNGGISFGGVIAFIFADLIVLRILDIYRRYYGSRMAGFLLATFYAAMVAAGLVVELVFGGLGLVPEQRTARVVEASVTWNYTTILNLVFPRRGRGAGGAVSAHRRPGDAQADERPSSRERPWPSR